MKRIISIVLFLVVVQLSAQDNSAYWSDLLLEQLNEFRAGLNLPELEQNEILEAAAFDQLSYCSELGKLVHHQDNEKLNTVYKRVLNYEGLFSELEENLAQINYGASEALTPNGVREEVDSDEKVIQAVLAAWLEDEKSSKLNLLDSNFYSIGVAVVVTNEVEHLFCVVFGNAAYEPLGNEKLSTKNYGIEPYDKVKCKPFLDDFPTLSSLFSDAIVVEGGLVELNYHSLPFLKQVLNESSDAVALDWVDASQFNCNQGNQLFPGSIASGYLQKPFKKSFVFAQNKADSIAELSVTLSKVPSFYSDKSTEVNLLFVKDGVHCATVPFNKLKALNSSQMEFQYSIAGESDSTVFHWKDSSQFTFSIENNGLDSLQYTREKLASINFVQESEKISVQVSPIHEHLLGEFSELNSENTVAWDSLKRFTRNTFYQLDMAELDSIQQLEYLRETSKEDLKLKNFLSQLNQIQFSVVGEAKVELGHDLTTQLSLYNFFLKNNQIEPALFVQANLLNKVRVGALKASDLPKADPSQKENTLAVINNQIVLEQVMGASSYGGNPIYLAFLELYLINQAEPQVAFNYHAAKLNYWSENLAEIKNFESWMVGFKKVESSEIDAVKYARVMMNYYLLAVNYYYEQQNFGQRKKSFVELMKWSKKAELKDRELLTLSQTLVVQDQIKLALQVIENAVNVEEPNQELLMYWLQLTIYDNETLYANTHMENIDKLQRLYPSAFCILFSKSKMGKQPLRNLEIKRRFCDTCN